MSRSRRPKVSDRLYIRALQRLRLEGLETGQFEPVSDREMMYLHLFRAGLRPDRKDFIVSKPLLQLETVLMEFDGEAAADSPPFTPAAEPAISPS